MKIVVALVMSLLLAGCVDKTIERGKVIDKVVTHDRNGVPHFLTVVKSPRGIDRWPGEDTYYEFQVGDSIIIQNQREPRRIP